MRVSPDEGIGEGDGFAVLGLGENTFREIFQVNLVDDAGHRRDDAEVFEGLLAPLQELVALFVAQEFHFGVAGQRISRGEEIHLHRVVDDEIDRHERVDLLRVAAQAGNGGAHRSQVNHRQRKFALHRLVFGIGDRRDAGEILHHHAGRQEGDAGAGAGRRPGSDVFNILLRNFVVVALAQGRFEHHTDGERQFGELHQPGFLQRVETVDDILFVAGFEFVT